MKYNKPKWSQKVRRAEFKKQGLTADGQIYKLLPLKEKRLNTAWRLGLPPYDN